MPQGSRLMQLFGYFLAIAVGLVVTSSLMRAGDDHQMALHHQQVVKAIVTQQAELLAAMADDTRSAEGVLPSELTCSYPLTYNEELYSSGLQQGTWVEHRNPWAGHRLINPVTGEESEPSNSRKPGSLSYLGRPDGTGYTITGYGLDGHVVMTIVSFPAP